MDDYGKLVCRLTATIYYIAKHETQQTAIPKRLSYRFALVRLRIPSQ